MEKQLRSNPSSEATTPKEGNRLRKVVPELMRGSTAERSKAQSVMTTKKDMSISTNTNKENKLIEILLQKETESAGSPNKTIELANDETTKNLFVQKKEMRHMKQQISSVLFGSIQNNNFDAFDIEDESIEKIIEKISFDESESMIKQGRVLIKNRIKRFNIIVNKSKGLQGTSFKILMSYKDCNFRNNFSEYSLIGQSKVIIPIRIETPGTHTHVYFQIKQESDTMIEKDFEEEEKQKYIKFVFSFGVNNFNAVVSNQESKAREQQ